jgi:hypothetical protein
LISREHFTQRSTPFRALSVLCVLLIAFIGIVQAVHVHSDNSKIPSHECTLCAIAHSGIITSALYRPVPVFVRSVLVIRPGSVCKSSGVVLVPRIRPPPAEV